tara:strand:- start:463 stop:789 length:327 start_codon:yes stop_codon:yes gene_type:complete
MTKVKEEMLYIEERVALNNIINDMQVTVDFLKRVSNGFSYRVHNVVRLDERVKSGIAVDKLSLIEVESLQDYLKSVHNLTKESLDDFQKCINLVSNLVDEVKNRTSGG